MTGEAWFEGLFKPGSRSTLNLPKSHFQQKEGASAMGKKTKTIARIER
jgi:hypothetical protein